MAYTAMSYGLEQTQQHPCAGSAAYGTVLFVPAKELDFIGF